MEQERAWTDVVRKALRDAEIDPPPGVWQRLEREREAGVAGLRQRRVLWRIGAAAAVVALCLLGGELWRQAGRLSEVPAEYERLAEAVEFFASGAGEPEVPLLAAVATPVKGVEVCSGAETEVAEAVEAAASTESVETPARSDAERVENTKSAEKTSSAQGTVQHRSVGEGRAPGRASRVSGDTRATRRTSFGLFGGGALSGTRSTPGVPTRSGMGLPEVDENGVLTINHRLLYESCSFRHRQPLSFGLTVRREFPHGLSLESGAVYTLLSSEVTPAPGASAIDQRLHFIGVPLRMNWDFFERNRFSLYIGMGGMVEKCIAARLGGRKVRESAVQWSAAAAVGAQYRLGDVVGLYFEPDLSYYFTRTDLRTARTNSPLTFTLRLGARFSF